MCILQLRFIPIIHLVVLICMYVCMHMQRTRKPKFGSVNPRRHVAAASEPGSRDVMDSLQGAASARKTIQMASICGFIMTLRLCGARKLRLHTTAVLLRHPQHGNGSSEGSRQTRPACTPKGLLVSRPPCRRR